MAAKASGIVTARIDPARIAEARRHGAVIAARPRRSRRRSWRAARWLPSSVEVGILVDRVETDFDADRGQLQDGFALDDLVGPTRARAGVEVDPPLILLDERVLPKRRRCEVIEFLASSILALGAGRNNLDDENWV